MSWFDGGEHDREGCLTALLLNAIILLGAAVIVVMVFR